MLAQGGEDTAEPARRRSPIAQGRPRRHGSLTARARRRDPQGDPGSNDTLARGVVGMRQRALALCLARCGRTDRLRDGDALRAEPNRTPDQPLQALVEDGELQLAHTGDAQLPRMWVLVEAQGWVVHDQTACTSGDGRDVRGELGLERVGQHRQGERERLEHQRGAGRAQGRSGTDARGEIEPDDLARPRAVDRFAAVGVHAAQPAHREALAAAGFDRVSLGERPGEDPHLTETVFGAAAGGLDRLDDLEHEGGKPLRAGADECPRLGTLVG